MKDGAFHYIHARKVVNISPESSFYQQLDLHDRAPPRADLCHICQRCFLTCSQLHLPQHQLLLKLSPFPRFSVRCAALPSTVRPHQLPRPLGVQALGAPTALEFMKKKKKKKLELTAPRFTARERENPRKTDCSGNKVCLRSTRSFDVFY